MITQCVDSVLAYMDIVLAIRYFVSPCIVCWPLGSVLAFDFSVTEKKQQESHFDHSHFLRQDL